MPVRSLAEENLRRSERGRRKERRKGRREKRERESNTGGEKEDIICEGETVCVGEKEKSLAHPCCFTCSCEVVCGRQVLVCLRSD